MILDTFNQKVITKVFFLHFCPDSPTERFARVLARVGFNASLVRGGTPWAEKISFGASIDAWRGRSAEMCLSSSAFQVPVHNR